jgi:hypothetical protein
MFDLITQAQTTDVLTAPACTHVLCTCVQTAAMPESAGINRQSYHDHHSRTSEKHRIFVSKIACKIKLEIAKLVDFFNFLIIGNVIYKLCNYAKTPIIQLWE